MGNDRTDQLLDDTQRRARRYVARVADRPVRPDPDALTALARFDEPLPPGPSDPAETIALLDETGSPATIASTGGRYFGFVTGATLPAALAAAWLGAAWDQNAALPVMSPVAAALHDVTRRWLVELLGLPSGTELAYVTGATVANATALAAARDQQLARHGWDVPSRGLFAAPELTVVVGERVHSTVAKSLGFIGLGRDRVVVVPSDAQGRMRADLLPDLDGPIVVCAQAGEVNTGAFDPFPAIVAWARARGAWVHVDGAFGLWAMADPTREHLVSGLSDADSWATDGHKWLNVTYDCGLVFVRDGGDLRRSFASVAGYLPPESGFEAMHNTPQSSQRARQIEVWAALRSLGRSGVVDLVQRTCEYARRIATVAPEIGLHVLNDVVLNQVLVRYHDDDRTRALLASVQDEGIAWCGPTVWNGRPAIRISVSSWATGDGDIAALLGSFARAARLVNGAR